MVLTEAERSAAQMRRRAQNATAQRAFRAKKKEQLKRLEAEIIAARLSGHSSVAVKQPKSRSASSSTHAVDARNSIVHLDDDECQSSSGAVLAPSTYHNQADASPITVATFRALIESCPLKERVTLQAVMRHERFNMRDVVKYGLIRLGYTMDPHLFDRAKDYPARAWMALVHTSIGGPSAVDFVAVIAAGIKLLATLPLPEVMLGDTEEEILRRVAYPPRTGFYASQITLSTESLHSALYANAVLLRIPYDEFMSADFESRSEPMPDAKPDLVPTAAQLVVAHHPVFKVLPWPAFRANICAALAHDPPLIDDDELCLDLMNDAVRCWGSRSSMHGRGQGAPWDARSWEAAPWFLEKWEGLTDGRDGDMWRTSAWWRSMTE